MHENLIFSCMKVYARIFPCVKMFVLLLSETEDTTVTNDVFTTVAFISSHLRAFITVLPEYLINVKRVGLVAI